MFIGFSNHPQLIGQKKSCFLRQESAANQTNEILHKPDLEAKGTIFHINNHHKSEKLNICWQLRPVDWNFHELDKLSFSRASGFAKATPDKQQGDFVDIFCYLGRR